MKWRTYNKTHQKSSGIEGHLFRSTIPYSTKDKIQKAFLKQALKYFKIASCY